MSVNKVWAQLDVHAGVAWPRDIQRVEYAGSEIQLVPPKEKGTGELFDTYPIAATTGSDRASARAMVPLVRRFLNALAWREQTSSERLDLRSLDGRPAKQFK